MAQCDYVIGERGTDEFQRCSLMLGHQPPHQLDNEAPATPPNAAGGKQIPVMRQLIDYFDNVRDVLVGAPSPALEHQPSTFEIVLGLCYMTLAVALSGGVAVTLVFLMVALGRWAV